MRRVIANLVSSLCAATVIGAGCRGAPPEPLPASANPAPPGAADVAAPERPLVDLPPDWREWTDLAFERRLEDWLPCGPYGPYGPYGAERRLSPRDLATLSSALSGGERAAVRAAVILARTRDPDAGEVLLARLEERSVPAPARGDAVEVVAAAAFAQGTTARDAPSRLVALAVGKRAHPDPCARVECARSALALGRDEPIPYLLGVLRIGTNAANAPHETWNEFDLALAQSRAAQALSERAGTAYRFRAEGSVREREDEAARLESLLPRAPKRS